MPGHPDFDESKYNSLWKQMPHDKKYIAAKQFLKQMPDDQRLGTLPEKLKKMRQFLRFERPVQQDIELYMNDFEKLYNEVRDEGLVEISNELKGLLLFSSANLSENHSLAVSMNKDLETKEDFTFSVIQNLLRKLLTTQKPIARREAFHLESEYYFDPDFGVWIFGKNKEFGFRDDGDGNRIDVFWNDSKRRYTSKGKRRYPSRTWTKAGPCYSCGKTGHIAKDCRSRGKRDWSQGSSRRRRDPRSSSNRSRRFDRSGSGSRRRSFSRHSESRERNRSRGSSRSYRSSSKDKDRHRERPRDKSDGRWSKGRDVRASRKDRERGKQAKKRSDRTPSKDRKSPRKKDFVAKIDGFETERKSGSAIVNFLDFDLQYPPPRVDAEVLKSCFRQTAGDNYFGRVADVNMMSFFLGTSDTEVWEGSGAEDFQDADSVLESEPEFMTVSEAPKMESCDRTQKWVSLLCPDFWTTMDVNGTSPLRYVQKDNFKISDIREIAYEIDWSVLRLQPNVVHHKDQREKVLLSHIGSNKPYAEIYASCETGFYDHLGRPRWALLIKFRKGWADKEYWIDWRTVTFAVQFKVQRFYMERDARNVRDTMEHLMHKEHEALKVLWQDYADCEDLCERILTILPPLQIANEAYVYPASPLMNQTMIEDRAPLQIEDRRNLDCFEISQSSNMMSTMNENMSVAYCYCIGCSAWVPYNDFGSVAASSKSIPVTYDRYSYHSESQMKSAHKLGPQGGGCNSRWVIGDVGVLGHVTGPVELKSQDNKFCFLQAQSHCAGPNLTAPVVQGDVQSKVFWIDADCSHNPVYLSVLNGQARIFVAVKMFDKVRAEDTEFILRDKFSIYVDLRTIDRICSSMKAWWSSLNDLGFEILQLPKVNFQLIDDSCWSVNQLAFESSYLKDKLHMKDEIIRTLPIIHESKNIRAHNVPMVTDSSFSPAQSDTRSMSPNLNVIITRWVWLPRKYR